MGWLVGEAANWKPEMENFNWLVVKLLGVVLWFSCPLWFNSSKKSEANPTIVTYQSIVYGCG